MYGPCIERYAFGAVKAWTAKDTNSKYETGEADGETPRIAVSFNAPTRDAGRARREAQPQPASHTGSSRPQAGP